MSWVLFFDGDCAFCNRAVRWVVRFDPQARIALAPLQGVLSQRLGFAKFAVADGGTMVVLREADGAVFTHSDGLLEIARALGGAWKICTIGRWIPRWLRDGVYRWIARNRYRLFGKSATCELPDKAFLKRLRE
jgi:predicted DCC family thiol-disulfide oxidoreductase YuxK